MSLHNLDKWNQIIYDLNGTCDSLIRVLDRHDAEELEDHMPFLEYLDNEIFNCECCGWWFELSEMAEGEENHGICEHCADQE